MFKIGKVTNYYEKLSITIIKLSGNLTVGDTIKLYKNGESILTQKIDQIIMNQQNVTFAKAKDVIALELNEKIQEGTEVFRVGQLGIRP